MKRNTFMTDFSASFNFNYFELLIKLEESSCNLNLLYCTILQQKKNTITET